MSKEQENLRDKFEEETNLKCWSEPHFEDVGFSDKYVEWLEKQLLLYNVVNRRVQLLAFAKWFIQEENINSTRPDTYVDDFLESQ